MGVVITAPKSAYTTKNATLSWQAITGQTGYQITWRLRGTTAWNTLGRVNSAYNSITLDPVYNAAEASGYSFKELEYRVIVYSTTTSGSETINKTDYSDTFSLIFKPQNYGAVNLRYGTNPGDVQKYPVFATSDIKVEGTKMSKPSGGQGVIPLVDSTHALAGKMKSKSKTGAIKSAAKDTPTFKEIAVNGYGEAGTQLSGLANAYNIYYYGAVLYNQITNYYLYYYYNTSWKYVYSTSALYGPYTSNHTGYTSYFSYSWYVNSERGGYTQNVYAYKSYQYSSTSWSGYYWKNIYVSSGYTITSRDSTYGTKYYYVSYNGYARGTREYNYYYL